ncbi:MAG: hypothetical protein PSX80_05550 [bacterium]|nr:hypothetical protein [bacterium]
MMNDWTEFKGAPMKVSMLSPWVTLGTKKDFYLNAKALDILGLPDTVRFFFDSARNIIGIRKVISTAANAFPVKKEERGSGTAGRIEASPFCTAFSIKPPYRIAFQDIHVDDDGMMILNLTTATRINGRKAWTRGRQNVKTPAI